LDADSCSIVQTGSERSVKGQVVSNGGYEVSKDRLWKPKFDDPGIPPGGCAGLCPVVFPETFKSTLNRHRGHGVNRNWRWILPRTGIAGEEPEPVMCIIQGELRDIFTFRKLQNCRQRLAFTKIAVGVCYRMKSAPHASNEIFHVN